MQIKIRDLYYRYPAGVQALTEINLDVPAGASVAIIGRNGSGKTTLARQLNGLLRPTSGQVWIGNQRTDQHRVAELARQVAYFFQNPDDQLCKRSVRAEVAFGPGNLGYPPERVRQLTEDALERLELDELAAANPFDLSPARRWQTAIAATIAMDTPIVVLDEPTMGRDSPQLALLSGIVKELCDQGKSVITISHDMDFVAAHFSRVLVLSQGRIIEDGSPADVFAQTDVLKACGIVAPQITRLGQRLGISEPVTTIDAFLAAYTRRFDSYEDLDRGSSL